MLSPKEQNLQQCGWMQRLSHQVKPDGERQIPYDITLWNLKYDTNQHIYETETDSQTSCIQYPVINHDGKEYEKIYTCVAESLPCTADISTTL